MNYQIIGKNIEITDAISSSVEKKMKRMDKYFKHEENINCRVVCSTHTTVQKVEVTIFLPKVTLRAEVKDEDLYKAIDMAIDKLEGQMRKLKTRASKDVQDRLSIGEAIALDNVVTALEKEKEEEIVVRAKSYYLEGMSMEEAITRMDALGHDFFLYLDNEDDRIAVVYKRKEGGYGVIEAENPIV
ncbi:MAG: ribosome-associated translation inhibitor RaiA [Coprobacillus sp.]|nr:ribosome-associated translation inhibitor RaiA [Coprobacillus sp.]